MSALPYSPFIAPFRGEPADVDQPPVDPEIAGICMAHSIRNQWHATNALRARQLREWFCGDAEDELIDKALIALLDPACNHKAVRETRDALNQRAAEILEDGA